MSDLLAIFGPTDSDSDLLTEIERLHPSRVTVLIESGHVDLAGDDGPEADALRDRLAALIALIERRTGAVVVGATGDRDQLEGWRFDRELGGPVPVAA